MRTQLKSAYEQKGGWLIIFNCPFWNKKQSKQLEQGKVNLIFKAL